MKKLKSPAILMLMLLTTFVAQAASTVGPSSSTSFTIFLAIQPSMAITTGSDISFSISNRDEDNQFEHPFCVRGSPSEKYRLVAYGSNGDGSSFTLRNDEDEILQYVVSFRGQLDAAAAFDVLTPGNPSPVYDVLSREQPCNELSSFMVTFRAQDLQSVGSGLYSGSLTLLVSPV